jgi:hypothetical protein
MTATARYGELKLFNSRTMHAELLDSTSYLYSNLSQR